ncbi:pyridoxamine 5'-phosphate oxidase family protein [bacterium]|nr:pyridoxamine 5'-phosphate oxidase family protein [bacterium]
MNNNIDRVFHDGELELQKLTNESQIAMRNGRVIKTEIITGAISFINQLTYVFVSSLDEQGNIWVSMLLGEKGFLHAGKSEIIINQEKVLSSFGDVFWKNVRQNRRMASICIELASRRRIRVNGSFNFEMSTLEVEEAYPNCPKYIQRRIFQIGNKLETKEVVEHKALSDRHNQMIKSSDTCFVGSGSDALGLDVSHRGGKAGFIDIIDKHTIQIPDYRGNSMYNTLGNFYSDSGAAILLLDFESNRVLQLTGNANVELNLKKDRDKSGGTNRYWTFSISKIIESRLTYEINWEYLDASPHNI